MRLVIQGQECGRIVDVDLTTLGIGDARLQIPRVHDMIESEHKLYKVISVIWKYNIGGLDTIWVHVNEIL